jgi:recombination protein RecA
VSGIETIVQQINKKYGDGSVVRGAALLSQVITRVTTGSLAYDHALGGGWPLNQWHEIVGDESSGKTVIALKTIAANMALDPEYTAFWVAAESLPMEWAERLGVDLERFLIHDTNVQEEAFDAVLEVTASRDVDCVVIDSLPALMPAMEDDQQMAEFAVGAHARLTGKFTRKGHKATKRSLVEYERPVLGIVINQWREKIGVLHGDPRTTPGGRAKNFFFFTRTEARRTEWLNHPENAKRRIGQRVTTRVYKNKSAPGQRTADIDFYFDEGGPVEVGSYDSLNEIINMGLATGAIERRGKFYNFRGERICEGRERLITVVRDHDNLAEEISRDVLEGPPEEKPPARKVKVGAKKKKAVKKRG